MSLQSPGHREALVEAHMAARRDPAIARETWGALPGDCPNFDRLARLYRWMELITFGPWLQWARCAWLDRIAHCRRGLVIGDGDGRFAARLLRANRTARLDAVDASSAMLWALAKRAGADAGRVTTYLADARAWQPESVESGSVAYDLIATHFFLDCLTTDEVRALAAALRRATSADAFWVISEFAVPRGLFGRLVAGPVVSFLYRVFGWLTGMRVRRLPDYSIAVREAGFVLQARREWLGGLLVSELWLRQLEPGSVL
jgi:hypothetical protein